MSKTRPKILEEIQKAIVQGDEISANYMLDVNEDILTIQEAAGFMGCSIPSLRTYMTPKEDLPLKIAHMGGRITPISIGADRTSPWALGKSAPLFYVVTRRMISDYKDAYAQTDYPIEPWQDELDQIMTIESAVEMFDISLHRMRQAVRNEELPVKRTKRPLMLLVDVAHFVDNMPIKPYTPGSRAKLIEEQVRAVRTMAQSGDTLNEIQSYLYENDGIEIDRSALSRMIRGITYAGVK